MLIPSQDLQNCTNVFGSIHMYFAVIKSVLLPSLASQTKKRLIKLRGNGIKVGNVILVWSVLLIEVSNPAGQLLLAMHQPE